MNLLRLEKFVEFLREHFNWELMELRQPQNYYDYENQLKLVFVKLFSMDLDRALKLI